MRFASLLSAALCVFLVTTARADDADQGQISFSKQIAPLLVKSCQACHGQKEPKGSYQLYTYELMLKSGDTGSDPITPGKPDDSELYRLIAHEDPDQRMPKEADPLKAT